ncbi:hypothetical protein L2X99_10015 [Microbacterium sp. KUDC0406]|uniref:hypothetical protein n=1 Tax=Microbacterium sp. KUDC0406 TaxID=2909588 RepID=UPI001F447661|nr:hypothetical protein [Microbacterium sp. KUDC0406]UJP08841.1 hypothetical protein L2X99_10015 [Microbacterium sp. KUDC0406]
MAGTGTTAQLPITFADDGGEPPVFAGTIDAGSGKVAAGKKLAITGSGYEPGETVTVELRAKKGAPVSLGTVKVGNDGKFSASVTVPKKTQPGKYILAVSQADGDEATATVHVNRAGGGGIVDVIRDIVDALLDFLKGLFG